MRFRVARVFAALVVALAALAGAGTVAIAADGDLGLAEPQFSGLAIEGEAFSAEASFDESVGPATACTVDYGDGSGPQAATVSGNRCVGAAHHYRAGIYDVTVRVTVGETSQSRSRSAYIQDVPPTLSDPIVVPADGQGPLYANRRLLVSVAFTDPGQTVGETYECEIDYADGSHPLVGAVVGNVCHGSGYAYAAAGTYALSVYVKGSGGFGTSAGLMIDILPEPNPISVDPPSLSPRPIEGSQVTARSTFSGGSGPATCTVDYGDGSGAQPGQISASACTGPAHRYAAGAYRITVTVSDGVVTGSAGASEVVANVAPAVTAPVVRGAEPGTIVVGAAVETSASFADPGLALGETYGCTIDFGDGTGAQAGTVAGGVCTGPKHTFGQAGSFAVTAVVTDDEGATGTAATTVTVARTIEITVSEPVLDPAAPEEGGAFRALATFEASPGAGPFTCTVDFGDGSAAAAGTIEGATCTGPEHRYAAGEHRVTVTVVGAGGATGSATKRAVVPNAAPAVAAPAVAAPGHEGPLYAGEPLVVTARFDDPGSALGETYACEVGYGDGSAAQAGVVEAGLCRGPSHAYKAPGTYDVRVSVADGGGASGAATATIEIVAPTGEIEVGAPRPSAALAEGRPVAASATFEPADATASCTVDYGDGSGVQAGTVAAGVCSGPEHRFAGGTYTVTVVVAGAAGTGSAIATWVVPDVAPTVGPVRASASVPVGGWARASATVTDPGNDVESATWAWGDGTTTEVPDPQSGVTRFHRYGAAGVYVVTLTVRDGEASATSMGSVVVFSPASALYGWGSIDSPAGACRLSEGCAAAGRAWFSVFAAYPPGWSRPWTGVAFYGPGFSLSATSGRWLLTGSGTATLLGTARVNGAAGFTFRLTAARGCSDGATGALRIEVWKSDGTLVYDTGAQSALVSGAIWVR